MAWVGEDIASQKGGSDDGSEKLHDEDRDREKLEKRVSEC